MKRRAPKHGYAFDAKSEYRNMVWRTFRENLNRIGTRSVFLMPSIEGLEIEVAAKHGFSMDRMHVCDFNPAIVATLKRRYPDVHTYGVSAERALSRVAAAGIRLDAVNLDFTSNISSQTVLDTIYAIPAASEALVALNVLRGREMGSIAPAVLSGALLQSHKFPRPHGSVSISEKDLNRLLGMRAALFGMSGGELVRLTLNGVTKLVPNHTWKVKRWGAYNSGRSTMLWAVFQRTALKRSLSEAALRKQRNLRVELNAIGDWIDKIVTDESLLRTTPL